MLQEIQGSRSAEGSVSAPAAGAGTAAGEAGCWTEAPSSPAAEPAVPRGSGRTLDLDGTVRCLSDWNWEMEMMKVN